MDKIIETIPGDTPGQDYRFTVLKFKGSDPAAQTAYLQAALHGNELPGVAALHVLIPLLEAAEREGRLKGTVTVVPYANPIGLGQHVWEDHQGRFSFTSRVNFNRDFQMLERPDASLVTDDHPGEIAEKRLKAKLLKLSVGHDLVLDLHCDDQSLSYLYVPAAVWPHMSDLATCLGSEAVLVFEGNTDGSFDSASIQPYLNAPPEVAKFEKRAVTTVEFRGISDVSPAMARVDGEGLYRFLVGRGVVADASVSPVAPYAGVAVPQDNVVMVRAPVAGVILYHAELGATVKAGDLLATIVTVPGEAGGSTDVFAEQGGFVFTRRSHRFTRLGDDLMKIASPERWAGAKEGALES
ncbi:succinylglutamate desuccinylase/aspartoacylase domain-containing protein [Oryzibacter oryziterrae]|uniref:succinylglutamate desuccinylase/aspartoacylase domain-containing protein n=1 Tax=Oryzibacter oryziterrae TaxID=2766474 RepID=UPI001F0182DA|nr:succinylglutamate desuccinylase/aspartoacylase family protein [Oryzibacter oryziterrae]